MTKASPRIVFIVGPTAAGKSHVAYHLALKTLGEIVSCDAMQVYRDAVIASNQPSLEMTRRVPHHLVGIVPLEEDFDVARFRRMAEEAIRDILSRGRLPIVVGGSGMYMQVLLDGIFEDEGKNEQVRSELKARQEKEGLGALYSELQAVDAEAAARIHPNDARRILRALEVCRTSRRPISELRKERSGLWGGGYDIRLFAVTRPRDELYSAINERVERMFADGLVEEVRGLAGRPLSRTAGRIIGISEVGDWLEGKCGLEEAKERMKMNTRRLAKRQLTWFRKEKRLTWLTLGAEGSVESAAQKIALSLGAESIAEEE